MWGLLRSRRIFWNNGCDLAQPRSMRCSPDKHGMFFHECFVVNVCGYFVILLAGRRYRKNQFWQTGVVSYSRSAVSHGWKQCVLWILEAYQRYHRFRLSPHEAIMECAMCTYSRSWVCMHGAYVRYMHPMHAYSCTKSSFQPWLQNPPQFPCVRAILAQVCVCVSVCVCVCVFGVCVCVCTSYYELHAHVCDWIMHILHECIINDMFPMIYGCSIKISCSAKQHVDVTCVPTWA